MTESLSTPIDLERVRTAFEAVCRELAAHQTSDGHWIGNLSASALSTATAVSALAVYRNFHRTGHHQGRRYLKPNHDANKEDVITPEELKQLDALVRKGVDWLIAHQNDDGGWGDTDKSISNVSTTLLVKSAIVLSDVYGEDQDLNALALEEVAQRQRQIHDSIMVGWSMDVLAKADLYLRRSGGIDAVKRRYGKDQTFSVPILTNAALAGLVPWKDVPQLPFERAALPQFLFRLLNLNVVSYAIPALVAIGQVRFHHFPGKKPVERFLRQFTRKRTLHLIEKMQPKSGGYLEAAPLTSFVVMSLVACGYLDHPIVVRGLHFLLKSVRDDGSWPIDTNLATWVTSLSVNAMGGEYFDPAGYSQPLYQLIDWILSCQHRTRHPYTSALPGGWGWTDQSGAVPDADDTAGALLALAELWSVIPKSLEGTTKKQEIVRAAIDGIQWLLKLQNADGGMPTFCRGWGMLPFDKSSTDLTAHTIRAFNAWRILLYDMNVSKDANISVIARLLKPIESATLKMLDFLRKTQQEDGFWLPLWFGNQHQHNDANPAYGTAKVLRALGDLDEAAKATDSEMIQNGLRWVVKHQNPDGGWGSSKISNRVSISSVEETAVILETLASFTKYPEIEVAYQRGLNWLLEAVESGHWLTPSPIGLYFAKLWYYEDLYPLIFTAAALKQAQPKQHT